MRSVISRTADRLLHTVALDRLPPVPPDVAEFHASIPVVDLLVGTPLFRPKLLLRRRRGHVDLPRLIEGGVDLVGFTIATRHPDLRGTLSTPHFWSLGVPWRALGSDMAMAGTFIDRVEGWAVASGGRLRLVREVDDLPGAGRGSSGESGESGESGGSGVSVRAFIGVQGGHVLEGDLANVERLHARGVRMMALAHVMDNALVGSNTGRRAYGLTVFGREVVAELERVGIVVDLAHMSPAGIRDTLPLLKRPFVLSHTGFQRLSGATSRIPGRRFTPRNRNLGDREARLVGEAGGVVGLTLSTRLLGGEDLDAVARTVDAALELCGPTKVAIGSDFDGALRMVCDVTGLPTVTARLLAGGLDRQTVAGVMGGNALRALDGIWSGRSRGPC
ncbi:MAG: membrane dipeptidase [Chloroflexi bacterium]|nr:membrane dipeptidase [Chloroflexota bacterium]